MGLFSFSKYPTVRECVGSAALPQIDRPSRDSKAGNVKHDFFFHALTLGREAALEKAPEAMRAALATIDLSKLPAGQPGAWAGEVALVYDVAADTAREIGRNIGRAYGALEEWEIPGSLDVEGLADDPDVVVVVDYKTGPQQPDPAPVNAQLHLQCLASCRARGRGRAVGMIAWVPDWLPENEAPIVTVVELDEMAIDEVAKEVRGVHARAKAARAAFQRNPADLPRLCESDRCGYCGAFTYCPAKARLAKLIAVAPEEIAFDAVGLTDAEAGAAWAKVDAVLELATRIKESLRQRAIYRGPLPLPSGKVLAALRGTEDQLDAKITADVVARLHGADVARAAMKLEASKTRLAEALRPIVEGRLGEWERAKADLEADAAALEAKELAAGAKKAEAKKAAKAYQTAGVERMAAHFGGKPTFSGALDAVVAEVKAAGGVKVEQTIMVREVSAKHPAAQQLQQCAEVAQLPASTEQSNG